ncbi:MAG: hypothetical protein RI556_08365 [Hydrogenovibrio sp.]|uniref:hypothetical protein n=1 Tax=Hydrogenovibrio TaxID=28884 RepID=UPI0003693E25|nr:MULTISPECIES: hypothetical protein [Hydrogenovibrio]MDR9499173.1 hypothetical protein [Hydrogenovibrio sp.]
MDKTEVTPSLRYFFKKMETRAEALRSEVEVKAQQGQPVPFDRLEQFVRAIMSQNIFIFTVGLNGKPESTILTKAMFSINKVVRLYYSISLDDRRQGFLRIRPDSQLQLILVERLHGYRPKPEVLYASYDECHVIRYFINWLMRRIDWEKTKIHNLELYKKFVEQERKELEEAIARDEEDRKEEELQQTLHKHFKGSKHKIPAARLTR